MMITTAPLPSIKTVEINSGKNNVKDWRCKMGTVMEMSIGGFRKRWGHKLLKCKTFWTFKKQYECPFCGHKYRCYWDGNDTHGTIDVCNKCAKRPAPKETP